MTFLFYSPESRALGVIFLIFRDSRHTVTNANSTSPTPAAAMNPTGTVKVHFTIPMSLKNNAVSGFITRLDTVRPMAVDKMVVGINERAVCRMS